MRRKALLQFRVCVWFFFFFCVCLFVGEERACETRYPLGFLVSLFHFEKLTFNLCVQMAPICSEAFSSSWPPALLLWLRAETHNITSHHITRISLSLQPHTWTECGPCQMGWNVCHSSDVYEKPSKQAHLIYNSNLTDNCHTWFISVSYNMLQTHLCWHGKPVLWLCHFGMFVSAGM